MSWAAQNLVFGYGAELLLKQVELAIAPGEVVGLLGVNGVGKSTLLHLLLGLLEPRTGSVSVDGKRLTSLSVLERARLLSAVVPSSAPPLGYSSREMVAMGRYVYGGAADRPDEQSAVERALRLVGIAHLADRRQTELSQGERQQVFLARALAQQTPYLGLDEPTAFLDLAHQHAVGEVLRREAAGRQLGVLWVLHDLNLALRYCDRVLALMDGVVVAIGSRDVVIDTARLTEMFGLGIELYRDAQGESHALFSARRAHV